MFAPLRRICNRNCAHLIINNFKQRNMSVLVPFSKTLPLCSTSNCTIPTVQIRWKSKGPKSKQSTSETESEEQEDLLDGVLDRHAKVVNVRVTSLRVDGLLKGALGMARNKIETTFYESRIRINGKKVPKKSAPVAENDEVDVIKGFSPQNEDFLVVARVEVLSIKAEEEAIVIKARRTKSLIIENYPDKFKG